MKIEKKKYRIRNKHWLPDTYEGGIYHIVPQQNKKFMKHKIKQNSSTAKRHEQVS